MFGRQGHKKLVSVGLLILVSGCEPSKTQDLTRTDSKKNTSSPSAETSTEPDGLVPPTPVTGTYLTCTIDRLASDADPSSQLACALVEASTQKKADLNRLVQNPEFSLKAPPSSGVRVSRRMLADDPRWHVLFTLKADSPSPANEALKTSELTFQGVNQGKIVGQKIPVSEAVAAEKNSSPPSASGLYTKVQSLALSSVTSAGETQYACRGLSAQDQGHHLGRVLANSDRCSFAYATSSESSDTFDYIAFPATPNWLPAADGTVPANALPLGNEGDGNPQYLCRAFVSAEGLVFGKIAKGYGGCNIFANSGYILVTNYEILVP